ncbi:MAG: hypothetical protein WEA99_12390 [Brumimicrobium sp.]
MEKQKTYAFVCLISLLLFFTGPVIFISGVVFDSLTEVNIEHVDLLDSESETENEIPVPLEEEQHSISIEIQDTFGSEITETINNLYLHSDWKSVPRTTITPPPDFI